MQPLRTKFLVFVCLAFGVCIQQDDPIDFFYNIIGEIRWCKKYENIVSKNQSPMYKLISGDLPKITLNQLIISKHNRVRY